MERDLRNMEAIFKTYCFVDTSEPQLELHAVSIAPTTASTSKEDLPTAETPARSRAAAGSRGRQGPRESQFGSPATPRQIFPPKLPQLRGH